jgi:RNA polymerase sigma factor (sigma-70 family)
MAAHDRSIDAVAAHLPFHLYETREVSRFYRQWVERDDADAGYIVDLWTYCYLRSYFLAKVVGSHSLGPADLEEMIDLAWRQVDAKRTEVRDADRYPSWVSTVCRNAFLNYLRTHQQAAVPIDSLDLESENSNPEADLDGGLLLDALDRAICRLPGTLRHVARLWYLEEYSFDDICRKTGKSTPIIRSYLSRSSARLRRDPLLLGLAEKGKKIS